jgi:hypothetical protein
MTKHMKPDKVEDEYGRPQYLPGGDGIGLTHDIAKEVAAGVEFAKLISMSSLGSPEARDARLLGRKEIEKHRGSIEESRMIPDHEARVQLAVADELEVRGQTYEAELLYRRLASGSRKATIRLAQLLESKGFRGEAWALYRRAGDQGEVNSLLRLSVICQQRGQKARARRLMRSAYNNLGTSTLELMEEQVGRAGHVRRQVEFGGHIAGATNTPNIDATYALGSYFFVVAERADLARLAYCSALGRGHSLAGVSLLDMTPRSRKLSAIGTSGYLDEIFSGEKSRGAQYGDNAAARKSVAMLEGRGPLLLKSSVQQATVNQLHEALVSSKQRVESDDALERVLINARLFTTIRGYTRLGTDTTLDSIRAAGDAVCSYVIHRARSGQFTSGRDLIEGMWYRSCLEIAQLEENLKKEGGTPRFNDRRHEFVPGSGVATRMGEQATRFSEEKARLITQRASGLYHEEVADAMAMKIGETREIYRSGVRELYEAQQGEQIPTSKQLLWEEVESSFAEEGHSSVPDLDSAPRYHPITGPEGEVPTEQPGNNKYRAW